MISQSAGGRALLNRYGWESPLNNPNVCVPKDPSISGLFKVPRPTFNPYAKYFVSPYEHQPKIKGAKYEGSWAISVSVSNISSYGSDDPRNECLQLIGSLSNPITVERATRSIKRSCIHTLHLSR